MVKMKSIKAIFRRGQQPSKIEGPTPENLSRASSINNLNVEKSKGAKPKKTESKDKLDKLSLKNEKKGLNKNNNKESGDSLPDSLVDINILQKQLAQMANDKTTLALQLGEQTGQLHSLQNEIAKLKMLQDESVHKLDHLAEENSVLRNRLRDVAHSPLSDNEKQQLLYESHRHHSSAPASIATNLLDDGADITACPTPEWDKHSSSNVSEISVACLQDKINQMQETHYSTNEELQATLQELTDLQKQLTELQQENLRLNDEKNLMFESLCRQTERLNDSRNEVDSLKQLLCKDENGQFETAAEREQKLVDLLKSAQEERESLLLKQEQLSNDLEETRTSNLMRGQEIFELAERVKTLESTLDAKHAEHKLLDQELALAKDQSSGRHIEINRLKDLLENARTKINELEQDRSLGDKSELDELLDNARKEKDALESEVTHLKEQLALSKNESEKLKEQVSILREECKVTRNNAKTTQSDLEYKLEKILIEKNTLADQLQQFQDALNELQMQAQCQLDDKRQLSAVLSETQRNLNESERKILDLENELGELKRAKQEQEEEWEKFQNDLLTSVRVANDFKTEAQQDLQKLIMENKAGRERIKQLETQIEKLKGGGSRRKTPPTTPIRQATPEERLMASLDRRYKEIENLTDDQLTEEQKAVKVLKSHYEHETPKKQKPIARKSKDKLAISKPSLESVVSNPKLGIIVQNSQMPTLEHVNYSLEDLDMKNRASFIPFARPEEDIYEILKSVSDDERSKNRSSLIAKVPSDRLVYGPNLSVEQIVRSKSLNDLQKNSVVESNNLKRYDSTENLLLLSKENKKLKRKTTATYDTLDQICNEIDPGTPENLLTPEQRFAIRLREVLRKQKTKVALKKNHKLSRKNPVISRPTQESVEQNPKLLQIIEDPIIKSVVPAVDVNETKYRSRKSSARKKQRLSLPVKTSEIEKVYLKSSKKSKSYQDISFRFKGVNMYSESEAKHFDVEKVLPPEDFRDVAISMAQSPVLTTFQVDSNTMKKEYNYLDDEELMEINISPPESFIDHKIENTIAEVHNVNAKNVDHILDKCEVDSSITFNQVANVQINQEYLSTEIINEYNQPEDFIQQRVENYALENIGDEVFSSKKLDYLNSNMTDNTIQHRLDEDYLMYDLDEEDLKARRKSRQRFSKVIEEMKEIMESTDEEDLEANDIEDRHLEGANSDDEKEPDLPRLELLELISGVSDVDVKLEINGKYQNSDEAVLLSPPTDFSIQNNRENKTENKTAEIFSEKDTNFSEMLQTINDFVENERRFVENTRFSYSHTGILKIDDNEVQDVIISSNVPTNTGVVNFKESNNKEKLLDDVFEGGEVRYIDENRTNEEINVNLQMKSQDGSIHLKEATAPDIVEHDLLLIKHLRDEYLAEISKEKEEERLKQDITESENSVCKITKVYPKQSEADLDRDLYLLEHFKEDYVVHNALKDNTLMLPNKSLTNEDKILTHRRGEDEGEERRLSHTLSEYEYLRSKVDLTSNEKRTQYQLTEDEEVLVANLHKNRSGRPVSDINAEDLVLLELLTEEYSTNNFTSVQLTTKHEPQKFVDYVDFEQLHVNDKCEESDLIFKKEKYFTDKETNLRGNSESGMIDFNNEGDFFYENKILQMDQGNRTLNSTEHVHLAEVSNDASLAKFYDVSQTECAEMTNNHKLSHKNVVTELENQNFKETVTDQIDANYKLTSAEQHLVAKVHKERPTRPISDINLDDLLLVKLLTEEYLTDGDNDDHLENMSLKQFDKTENRDLFTQKLECEKGAVNVTDNHAEKTQVRDGFKNRVERLALDTEDGDLFLVEQLKDSNDNEEKDGESKVQIDVSSIEERRFPRILSPTKLNEPTTYEPVYANLVTSPSRFYVETAASHSGKKPIAAPRISSFENEAIYRDFGGQLRKTRFSINYQRKSTDEYKDRNDSRRKRVKDLKEVFERKSASTFPTLVSKALDED